MLSKSAPSMSDDEKACRPSEILQALGRRYPEAWQICEEFRAAKGVVLPNWPDWCYLPLPGIYAIVSGRDAKLSA